MSRKFRDFFIQGKWLLLAAVACLATSCNFTITDNGTGGVTLTGGSTGNNTSGSTYVGPSGTLFTASLTKESPSGDASVNQPVLWQVTTQINEAMSEASSISQFQVTATSPSTVDVTYSKNGEGTFSVQYPSAETNTSQSVTVQAQDADGNDVGEAVVITSLTFNVDASEAIYSCVTVASNDNATIAVNSSGSPVGSSTVVTYTSMCSAPSELLSVTSPHGTFSAPSVQANGAIVVTGTFSQPGNQLVTLQFAAQSGQVSAETNLYSFVTAVPITPTLTCNLTGSSVVQINVNQAGAPLSRSTDGTYTISSNLPFSITALSNQGGFASDSNTPEANNTDQFTGNFAAGGTFPVSVTITSGSQTATCSTDTVVTPVPQIPPPQPLYCQVTGTSQVSISVDQNGNPDARSGEVDYTVVTNHAASPVNLSSAGGFGAFSGLAGVGDSFLIKGTFGLVGTYNFWITMQDSNGLQATCATTTNVTPSAPPTQDVFRSYKPRFDDHLLSLDPNEGPNAGYVREQTQFATYTSPTGVCAVPLYGCRLRAHHFASNDPGCEGQITERFLGWVCAGQAPGTQKLYRIRSKNYIDHLTTPWWSDVVYAVGQLGYVYEGPQGFAPQP